MSITTTNGANSMTSSKTNIAPGVITGDEVQQLFAYAKANAFALSAINVTGSNTINAKGEN
jgi:fructose-bisphosphate aldolase class II|tara:strand:- start:72 stop:254 length:183 start_codon:yes stop_codon:yes gene_type:complete